MDKKYLQCIPVELLCCTDKLLSLACNLVQVSSVPLFNKTNFVSFQLNPRVKTPAKMNNKSKAKNKLDLLLTSITCNCEFCNQIKILGIEEIQEKLSITDDEVENTEPLEKHKRNIKSKLLCKNTLKYVYQLFSVKRRQLKSRTDAKTKRTKEKQEEETLEAEIFQMREDIQKYPMREYIVQQTEFYQSGCQEFEDIYGPIV